MIRLTYISSIGKQATAKDIRAIGAVSEENNERDGLTGVLLCFRGVFYQIIEGEEASLYRCFDRIKADPRHRDLFVLNVEKDIPERMYTQWKMKTVFLDSEEYPLVMPIRNLLDSLTQTHRVLKQYAPYEVLDGLQNGEDPLAWEFKREELIVLFSDIISFTAITEKINLAEMQELLGAYFGIASEAIVKSGGRIAKLTGDGFMAYYPASQAASALQASLEIIRKLKKQRETTVSPFLKLAYCGIGLSAGSVVMGNIGADTRQDYTILGDVVNSASRLESYTREAGHSILFDDRFRNYLEKSPTIIPILQLGEQTLKGKSKTLTVYTVDNADVRFDRTPEEITREIREI
ncbi:MAG: BLUF domain-containing protein [Saprospiraceae bacterium]|nr:BLUF domain-containing protein [Saprospiraceae bacterium]MCF8249359.1 BLUF domain-containing protein [Saprospiraceae bacterium]MCF8279011.1 BLUF domain-containing protein [Bacteroidales bacterium]MCF8311488.1 BLUF domain-containing protein [Saprospiraceae bacterium]MCF8439978.1 BLUF domain-containing protein [Saprospiraceae bacterium]